MKSFLWKTWFIIFMFFCLLGYFVVIITKLFLPKKTYRKLIQACVRFWARTTVLTTGSKVDVQGLENLPKENNICFISNHQGMFDIPLVLGFVGKSTGFIAKRELLKVPVLAWWMLEIPCVFIDRGSARKARDSFIKSAEVVKKGHPMVIFPEGTRARSSSMGEFKLGSFKLPIMAGATIVPLVINNTYKIMEETGKIQPAQLSLKVLKPIYPSDPIYQDQHLLSKSLHERIEAELKAL